MKQTNKWKEIKAQHCDLSKPPCSHSEARWQNEGRHLSDRLYRPLHQDTWVELSVLFQPVLITS